MILNGKKTMENRKTKVLFLSPCNFPFTAIYKDLGLIKLAAE